ncbi:MAG: glycosyltransferase [Bacillota bacterium]
MNNKKRIVFVNMHSNWMVVKSPLVYLFKFSAAIKHAYILDYLLHTSEYEVCNYINQKGFSILRTNNAFLTTILNKFSGLECKKTFKVNKIDRKKITILCDKSEIRQNDLIVLYNICKDNYIEMSGVNTFKALSMIHFSGNSKESEIIKNAGVSCLFNECNLSKNSEIYKRCYDLDMSWVVHPFVFAERFKNNKPFEGRKNMAFATGTITYRTHEEHMNTYGDSCVQPLRKQIKDNPEHFKDTIYCTSSDYLEDNHGKVIKEADNIIVKIYKKIYNKTHVGKQKKYFSFDMVEAFNDYKMCIVAEECLGIPGIGFVEGMACGCAYIGIDIPAYRDWGMIPGEHFITYDGTKEHLKEVIEYYQKDEHQEELERIAKAGCEFVKNNFNGDTVAKKLIENLVAEQEKWLANRN